MIFRGSFDNDKNIEKLEYKFMVSNDINRISLNLNKGPFEHIIISLEDSEGRNII